MGNCFKSKQKREIRMLISGSHDEKHLKLKPTEKASEVPVHAGINDLRRQYNIDRRVLGKGSFGEVFKAVDKKNSEHKVAIKVIKKKNLK